MSACAAVIPEMPSTKYPLELEVYSHAGAALISTSRGKRRDFFFSFLNNASEEDGYI